MSGIVGATATGAPREARVWNNQNRTVPPPISSTKTAAMAMTMTAVLLFGGRGPGGPQPGGPGGPQPGGPGGIGGPGGVDGPGGVGGPGSPAEGPCMGGWLPYGGCGGCTVTHSPDASMSGRSYRLPHHGEAELV